MNAVFCVPCSRRMMPHRIGIDVLTYASTDRPYQLFSGDQLKCPECGALSVLVAGGKPIEHFDSRFGGFVEAARAAGTLLEILP